MPRYGQGGAIPGPHRPRRSHGVLQPLLPIRDREHVPTGQGERSRRIHRRRPPSRRGCRPRQILQQARPLQHPPHRPHHHRSTHRTPRPNRLHLHLLRIHHGRHRRPRRTPPGPQRLHRPRPPPDRPPPRRRIRHLQPPDGPVRGQPRRRSGRRKCHSQNGAKGGEHPRGTRRGRQEDRTGTERGVQAGEGGHQPGDDFGTQAGGFAGGRDRQDWGEGEVWQVRGAVHSRDAFGGVPRDRGAVRFDQE
mmetsp:Transcript_16550/g.30033  ORF Transcript_16550/g.30033 Transcript_16550/m.30033 type:complete len:248 (-) Transcript_16550:1172-1915(-)